MSAYGNALKIVTKKEKNIKGVPSILRLSVEEKRKCHCQSISYNTPCIKQQQLCEFSSKDYQKAVVIVVVIIIVQKAIPAVLAYPGNLFLNICLFLSSL